MKKVYKNETQRVLTLWYAWHTRAGRGMRTALIFQNSGSAFALKIKKEERFDSQVCSQYQELCVFSNRDEKSLTTEIEES